MASLGTLALEVVAKTAPFTRAIRKAKAETGGFAREIRSTSTGALRGFHSSLGGLSKAIPSLTVGLGALTAAAGTAGAAFAKFAFDRGREMETLKTSFRVLLGSADSADKLVSKLSTFSRKTPFTPGEVFGAGRQLLASGSQDSSLLGEIRVLGDLAAGSGAKLGDLAFIYGKIRTKGKASLEEINQLTERSINLLPALQSNLGVTKDELSKMISAGKVGLPEIVDAMKSMTSESGMFYNAMKEQSKTTNGQLSTMQGHVESIGEKFGTAALKSTAFAESLGRINQQLENFDADGAATKTIKTLADTIDNARFFTAAGVDLGQTITGNAAGVLGALGNKEMAELSERAFRNREKGRAITGALEVDRIRKEAARNKFRPARKLPTPTTNGGVRSLARSFAETFISQVEGVSGTSMRFGQDVGARAQQIGEKGLVPAVLEQRQSETTNAVKSLGSLLQRLITAVERNGANIQVARPA